MKAKLVLLPGDGIGPEITMSARRVLETVAELFGHQFQFDTRLMGGCAIDEYGDPLPASTLEAFRAADAILLGAVGDPSVPPGVSGRWRPARTRCWAWGCRLRAACRRPSTR